MDSTTHISGLTPLRVSLVALAVLAPACELDTKITGNPDDASTSGATTDLLDESSGVVTTGGEQPSTGTTGGSGDTGDATDTGDMAGEACELPYELYMWPFATKQLEPLTEPIDEACTVLTSEPVIGGFELHMDCPQYGVDHGEFELQLLSAPFPEIPQVGDVLDVYYQAHIDDFITTPRPAMLFLHSDGELLFSFVHGFFIDPNDVAIAAAHYAPLTVEVEQGPCPLVDDFAVQEPGDGFTCARQALANVRIGLEGSSLVLGMGMMADISAGPATYAASVLWATWGEDCVDVDLEKSAVMIVRTPGP